VVVSALQQGVAVTVTGRFEAALSHITECPGGFDWVLLIIIIKHELRIVEKAQALQRH